MPKVYNLIELILLLGVIFVHVRTAAVCSQNMPSPRLFANIALKWIIIGKYVATWRSKLQRARPILQELDASMQGGIAHMFQECGLLAHSVGQGPDRQAAARRRHCRRLEMLEGYSRRESVSVLAASVSRLHAWF